jgi:hypothetical protein
MLSILFRLMSTIKNAIDTARISDEMRNWYAFEGPSGEVVYNARSFFAWKDEHLIGTYSTLKEAVEALKLKERRRKRER